MSERREDLRRGSQRLLLLLLQLLLQELHLVLLRGGGGLGGWRRRRGGHKDGGVEQEGGAVRHLRDKVRRSNLQRPLTAETAAHIGTCTVSKPAVNQAAAQWPRCYTANLMDGFQLLLFLFVYPTFTLVSSL